MNLRTGLITLCSLLVWALPARAQEAIVTALLAHYGGTMGITERTLNGKFANARKNVRSAAA